MNGKRDRRSSKYAHLLESDPIFSAWHASVLRGSHLTGSDYFLRMEILCD
jgi:hypothetical protein